IELGQLMRRFGAEVTIVEMADRLLAREEPAVGEVMATALAEEGIELRLGAAAKQAAAANGKRTLTLGDGEEVSGQELLVAAGRSPRVAGLGLESLGIEFDRQGVRVDDRCRAGDGVWAVGDVTGVMPFTHVGMYQARVVVDDIAGNPRTADYTAIPRVVFSDPEIAAVGLTDEQARQEGLDVATARVRLAEAIARPWTYEQNPRGELGLIADRDRGLLVGAWAVAPLAGEWIHYAALAIKAQTPLEVLRDTVAQFPTFCEAYLKGIERLDCD
ncbi:MAG: NAD(P)/FAD-dependent oxidoreductase, partial [Actinomycetota bacterium]|nr:NAD(P)/FAD-dependent oxidoreductase [Actinomycetota bacterium]